MFIKTSPTRICSGRTFSVINDGFLSHLFSYGERFHKDDSVLSEVLKEIEKEKGIKVPDPKDAGLSEKIISEKKQFIGEVNRRVASNNIDFAESTKYKLTGK